MGARISDDIIHKRQQSLFMRTAPGHYALREWRAQYKEYISRRFKRAEFDELVVVFPAASLRKYVPCIGLYNGTFETSGLYSEIFTVQRRLAEERTDIIQLVTFFI